MPRLASLSFDLLETFITVVDNDGDAAEATKILKINQPSMSKRLGYLQHAGRVLDHPWLVRIGKSWQLTDEGQRVLPAVREIISRYEMLTAFIEEPRTAQPQVRFACGQQAVSGYVRQAVRHFRRSHPEVRLRISTLRGRERIERVANGLLDLATVTHDEAAIHEIARRPLYVETIGEDRLALVCTEKSPWSEAVRKLPKSRVSPEAMTRFPLLLPEPDAGIRKGLDKVFRDQGLLEKLDIALEIGGWSAILTYVREGAGVGVVSEAAIRDDDGLLVRYLIPDLFPPIATRLICRRVHGTGADLDLSTAAEEFRGALHKARSRGE